MPSKIERIKARMKSVTEKGKRIARNVMHSGETLVAGSATAYAEGRLSDDQGEWGVKGVPYAYIGGGLLYLGGLFAGEYGADMFALGTGTVGAHLFRNMYEHGLDAKQQKTTGRMHGSTGIPMGLPQRPVTQQVPQQQYGTVFDRIRSNVNG